MTLRWAHTLLLLPMLLLAGPATADEDDYRQMRLLADVLEKVRENYVEAPEFEEMVEAAINGMLASLDPHSSYLNSKSFQDMQVQTKGEFGGLGIEVTMEGGFVKVVSPIDDTPAFRAGLKPGDLVTHLDGEAVQGLTLTQAVEKMRGPKGSQIQLTIRRQGEAPFDVTITRAVITIESVRWRAEDDVGYLRITSFSEKTEAGLDKAVGRIREEIGDKLKGFVLDLRNNPGGLLDQAVAVSDAFLERGEIVSTRGRRKRDAQRFNAEPGDVAEGMPIVVLINGGSASASEIVAGALRDHRRAVLVGTRSFGKGSVQTIMPIKGHGAVRLTTARYYTPSGISIQAKGIQPDIEIEQAELSLIESRRRRESDLRGALDRTDAPGDGAEEKTGERKDYQLTRALDLLRALALYGGPDARN